MIYLPILAKNFPQSYLIVIRQCPQNNITHIEIYQYFFLDSISLDSFHFHPPLPFPQYLNKFHKFFMITFSVNILVFFIHTIIRI